MFPRQYLFTLTAKAADGELYTIQGNYWTGKGKNAVSAHNHAAYLMQEHLEMQAEGLGHRSWAMVFWSLEKVKL